MRGKKSEISDRFADSISSSSWSLAEAHEDSPDRNWRDPPPVGLLFAAGNRKRCDEQAMGVAQMLPGKKCYAAPAFVQTCETISVEGMGRAPHDGQPCEYRARVVGRRQRCLRPKNGLLVCATTQKQPSPEGQPKNGHAAMIRPRPWRIFMKTMTVWGKSPRHIYKRSRFAGREKEKKKNWVFYWSLRRPRTGISNSIFEAL